MSIPAVLAATTVLSGLLGWLAAGRVLRPVRVMATTARTISAGNLHERLAVAGPDDEFKQLGDTLDDLFGRLEASFEAQRRFVANASHELRTPLTLERTLLELALADPNANAHSLRATCEELLASSRDQERLLESLLTLASSERGLEYREPMDLSEIVEQALVGMRAAAKDESLTINAQLEPAPAEGDTTLVARLVGNLIDNATSHNVPEGHVGVRTATDNGHAILSVTNTGPVIPPEEVERLFEPFHRFESERVAADNGHHGLGLSIVRAIAGAHDATVTVRPQPTGGLTVTVRFPRAQPL